MDGFAITALVLGLAGAVLPSVVLALVALARIGRGERRGRGPAVAGLVLSGLWVLLFGTLAVVGLLAGAGAPTQHDASAGAATAGTVLPEDLRVGDCVRELLDAVGPERLTPVACDQPHRTQVFATPELATVAYPGDDLAAAEAETACEDGSGVLSEDVPDVAEVYYSYPDTRVAWMADRGVVCLVTVPSGPALTTSLVGPDPSTPEQVRTVLVGEARTAAWGRPGTAFPTRPLAPPAS